ncbi:MULTISPECIES: endonuclease/exonuclease/phosphatase family protein [Parachlamydia]|jgi:endonuclease/exonuclease/phosphatase family metal-dependent hydrolase|uniref:Endonuclease/exonuclease/phosphatase domain-containing protein n=2 Tax=Parachlamydia acanthamoebae TaxID=83552 RepID=F8KW74_PARAV|nr:endonuclease/exonuclease/phosphatase family protein [Parachlamydia acanthamoebae]EFB40131.1 hypothetical protein pah_c260o038 [Parachlamydia acanthamoebae str. Hall's coccus]KIA78502.1 hypothetical protein DB43_DX00020 [Parachlamydia acanthamoebae]CCB85763.1 putative uncharacterized protein [Parachlamydia acanthamoebae UV-7]
MKLFLRALFFFSCLSRLCLGEISNSIIPLMEQIEQGESLSQWKYSQNQWIEIQEGLGRKEEKIRVVSYNMLFNYMDNRLDEVHRWPNRCSRVVELIQAINPDLIGSQELQQDQVEDLLSFLGDEYAFYGKGTLDGKMKGEVNGIFYRKSRFNVDNESVLFMSSTPHTPGKDPYSFARTLTILELEDFVTGKRFAIANAHVAFGSIDSRDYSVRFMASHISKMAKRLPVIITADLNTFPHRQDIKKFPAYDGDYLHRLLTSAGLLNAQNTSLLGFLGPLSTYTNDDGETKKGGFDNRFLSTGTPGVFLDHVYVGGGITVLLHAIEPAKVDQQFPSDHLPVIVDLIVD